MLSVVLVKEIKFYYELLVLVFQKSDRMWFMEMDRLQEMGD